MAIEYEVREEVLQDMKEYVNSCSDPEVPFATAGSQGISMADVLSEVENKTDRGKTFYQSWEGLYDRAKRSNQ